MAENIGLRSRDGILIWDADNLKGHAYPSLHQNGGAGFAESAVNHVFFDRYHGATFPASA